jgi:hypothetical protein
MPTGYRALGFPDSKMPGYGRTRGSIGSSLLQINADSTLHLLMLSSCLLRSKSIQPFLFFPCSANTPPENTPAGMYEGALPVAPHVCHLRFFRGPAWFGYSSQRIIRGMRECSIARVNRDVRPGIPETCL